MPSKKVGNLRFLQVWCNSCCPTVWKHRLWMLRRLCKVSKSCIPTVTPFVAFRVSFENVTISDCWAVLVADRENWQLSGRCAVINALKVGSSLTAVIRIQSQSTNVIQLIRSDINYGAVCVSVGGVLDCRYCWYDNYSSQSRHRVLQWRIQKSSVGRMWSKPSSEGVGCGEGVPPSPPLPGNSILDLKMASFGALWVPVGDASPSPPGSAIGVLFFLR